MDESAYLERVHRTFGLILDAFESIDVEEADIESTGDVLTIRFRGGARCVINTQRPTRQIWFAGGNRAFHFGWDESSNSWRDDKSHELELFTHLRTVASSHGVELELGA